MVCERCSRQTSRSRLCKHCATDERHGQSLDADDAEDTGPTKRLTIECCGCESVREVDASARKQCECGYEGYRVLKVRTMAEVMA